MSYYSTQFSLSGKGNGEAFVNTFKDEMRKFFDEAPEYRDGFGGMNLKEKGLSCSCRGGTFSIGIDGDDVFCEDTSDDHEKEMTALLKKCIQAEPEVSFTAKDSIGCYVCGDNGEVEYVYDGKTLTVKGLWECDGSKFTCRNCGESFWTGDVLGEDCGFEEWDPTEEYLCPVCGKELKAPFFCAVDEYTLENGEWSVKRIKTVE